MGVLQNISYGVYILTAKGEKHNGAVINTLMQITSSPKRISITVNKENYTTEIIQQTGEFNVSILDMLTSFDLIKRFGFSSGRNINKFEGFVDYKIADNGIAYITRGTNSYISAKVISSVDNGTHITFFADVVDEKTLSNEKSITYAYYQESLKPKQKLQNKTIYVCKVCGYVYEGEVLPDDFICPICKHGAEDFEKVEKSLDKNETERLNNTSHNKKYICPICGYEVESENAPQKCIICGAEMQEK